MKRPILLLTVGALLSSAACSTPSPSPETSNPHTSAGKGSGTAGVGGTGTPTGGAPSVTGGAGTGAAAGRSSAGTGAGGSSSGTSGASGTGAASGASNSAGVGGGSGAGGAPAAGASGAGGVAGSGGAPPAGGKGAVGAVENSSADCPVPTLKAPSELPTIAKFPDPFTTIDGTRLTKTSEWRCRRQEILEQAKKYIYGQKPAFDVVTGTVTSTKITVHVEAMGKMIDFSADVVLPTKGQAPYPAIINVGPKGGFGGIALGESRILDQGVAVIYYNHNEIGTEGQAEQSRGKPNPGKFYDIYGGNHSAGLLMAWAWGASRLIDVLQKSPGDIIDSSSLGVTGCSRNGKGAFTVGVFDERIALTIPHETSTGGVPAYRIVDILNTERTDHNYFGLNWLSNDFEPFVYKNNTSNAVKLPIDTHSLVASIAPRGLLVLENPHPTQMSSPAGHIATLAGAEVYKALGLLGNISYHSNVSDTAHCSYKNEYTELLAQTIGRFLKHENEEPGRFDASTIRALKLSDWKDWETPTLVNDTSPAAP